jgi:rRNA maturation RNase YbeY
VISFDFQADFVLEKDSEIRSWLEDVVDSYGKNTGNIGYVFCNDEYLFELNKKYLQHKTYTDIITFDYTVEDEISAEIYISVDRVKENSKKFNFEQDNAFEEELLRVMAHGVLHCIGFKDSCEEEQNMMRTEETKMIEMFHVKQQNNV